MTDKKDKSLQKQKPMEVEYQPFGSSDKIKLSMQIVKSYIATPTRSGKLPTDKDIVNFIMLCKARELNPFEGDAFLTGFDTSDGPKFQLITAHQAFLKRGVADQNYKGMESGVIVKDDDENITEREGDFLYPGDTLLGGWATVYFADDKLPIKRKLNLDKYNKGQATWKTNPAMMIVKCAEADALRSAYPNKVSGLYLREEIESTLDEREAISMPEEIPMPKAIEDKTTQAEPEPPQDEKKEPDPTPEPEEKENASQGISEPQIKPLTADQITQLKEICRKSKLEWPTMLDEFCHLKEYSGTVDIPEDEATTFADFIKSKKVDTISGGQNN